MSRPIKHLVIGQLFFWKLLRENWESMKVAMNKALAEGVVEKITVRSTQGMSVDMARTRIIQWCFMAPQQGLPMVDAVGWFDTDMIFPEDSIVRLVEILNQRPDVPIAAGIYRRAVGSKDILTELTPNKPATLEELKAEAAKSSPVKTYVSAGGFSLVRMSLYESMRRFYKWNQDLGDAHWYTNYYHEERYWSGEDRAFLLRAAKMGAYAYVDPYLQAIHWLPNRDPVPVDPSDPRMKELLGFSTPSMGAPPPAELPQGTIFYVDYGLLRKAARAYAVEAGRKVVSAANSLAALGRKMP